MQRSPSGNHEWRFPVPNWWYLQTKFHIYTRELRPARLYDVNRIILLLINLFQETMSSTILTHLVLFHLSRHYFILSINLASFYAKNPLIFLGCFFQVSTLTTATFLLISMLPMSLLIFPYLQEPGELISPWNLLICVLFEFRIS